MDFGFIRVAAAVPRVKVADVDANVEEMCKLVEQADNEDVSIILSCPLQDTRAATFSVRSF